MANAHGHLPKADSRELTPELERRRDAWFEKAYRDDNLFLTLAREPVVLELFLAWVSLAYAGRARLDPKVVELCRIRLAARNACVH